MKIIKIDRNLSDFVKLIACIMVALSHYAGYYLVTISSQNILWKIVAANFGYIGVALFFFLSGYGLAKSDQKLQLPFIEYFKRRIVKVYLPASTNVSPSWYGINSPFFVNVGVIFTL